MKHHSKIFFGSMLIIIGLLFFLKNLGVLTFPTISGFATFWPVGLILVGIALILKRKWIASGIIFITIVLGILHLVQSVDFVGESREVIQTVPSDFGVEEVTLNLAYGAGDVTIQKGSANFLMKNTAQTADSQDPEVDYDRQGNKASISVERHGSNVWHHQNDEWDIELSEEVLYVLDMDYGAADIEVDLRGLQVDELSVETGASNTEITFDKYPTSVTFDMGASNVDLNFPKDYPVIVRTETGLTSIDLEGFKKESSVYRNEYYKEGKPAIEIEINAGASSIEGDTYE